MNHSKVLAVGMATAMLMGVLTVTASACTLRGVTDDGEPNVIPCSTVEERGYCNELLLVEYSGWPLHTAENPYYKEPPSSPHPYARVIGKVGGHPELYDPTDAMMHADAMLQDYANKFGGRGCSDIINYDTLTLEYADKSGQLLGYKTVVEYKSPRGVRTNHIFHYDPDGNEITGYVPDWNAENPFVHYEAAIAAKPSNTAYASTQTVDVDGKEVTFECYALKDEDGNLSNYIKLRDLALLLNGSAAQFQVGWDGSITITTNTAYTPNGSELATPYTGDRTYQETTTGTKVDGQDVDLAAFVLNDDNGGGYTYYQLRDLGKILGFNVGWSADKGIFVETSQPYDPAN